MLRSKMYLFLVFLAMIAGCGASTPKAITYQVPLTVPDIYVDIYKPDKAYNGTTLLADNHKKDQPKIIEMDMNGRIIWEYVLPNNLRKYNNPGFDVERLSNGNILFVLPLKGIYEINRRGDVVWSYLDKQVTHDADRLPNGNILITGTTKLLEFTTYGELVWRLNLDVAFRNRRQAPALGFYKAQRQ